MKTLVFDFDGVIHSYASGWQGARVIADGPVPGAIEFLAELLLDGQYQLCIYSSRSSQWGGRRAMRKWLREWFVNLCRAKPYPSLTGPLKRWMEIHAPAGAYYTGAGRLVRAISWPTKKPPAWLTIDDRAVCFDGYFGDLRGIIETFQPWHQQKV
jgi:hypothetical protein